MNDSAQSVKPRVLLLDVETTPIIGYTWKTWETNVIKIIQHRQIFCFSWKWLGDKTVNVVGLCDFPGYKIYKNTGGMLPPARDNRLLIKRLNEVMSGADIVVGHNIKKFDDKRANTDLIKNGFAPPPPHRLVDTLEFARHKFDFESNKLDDLGKFLGVGRKVKHWGFELWERCMYGDPEAWTLMKKYNKGDVWPLLEGVYLKLRPWMAHHPNMNAIDRNDGCPVCRSRNLETRGYSILTTGKRPRFRCKDCGKWSTGVVIRGKWEFRGRA